jgi:hypothetical protein
MMASHPGVLANAHPRFRRPKFGLKHGNNPRSIWTIIVIQPFGSVGGHPSLPLDLLLLVLNPLLGDQKTASHDLAVRHILLTDNTFAGLADDWEDHIKHPALELFSLGQPQKAFLCRRW